MDQTPQQQTRMQEERQQSSSRPLLSSSPLESLPTEVLVSILPAACSTVDLGALIRSSPVVYKVFLSAKRTVLFEILARDLGPALRDAVAATLITHARIEYWKETYFLESERAIQRYEALPRGDAGLASVRGLPMDNIVTLIRVNRSVQFLVDEFAASRLPEFRKICPDAAGPLSPNERHRLARALLCHQFLARIESNGNRRREPALLQKLFDLLQPWQMHQLADINAFVNQMLSSAFRYCKARFRSHQPGEPWTQWELDRDSALRDLVALHRKLVTERARAAANPWLISALNGPFGPLPRTNQMAIVVRFELLIAGPLPAQSGTDLVNEEFWGLRDDLYRREDAMPPLVLTDEDHADEYTDEAPPFAWVDAHAGLNCQRWGRHAHREVLPAGQEAFTSRQRIWMRAKLDQWRWLGFCFLDRARVKLLKTRLPEYATGWLMAAPPADEDCRFPDRPPRRPRPPRQMPRST